MDSETRHPRSHEANWEGIPIWTLPLLIVITLQGCGRRWDYRPTGTLSPTYWVTATIFAALVVLTLKLHRSRHKLAVGSVVVLVYCALAPAECAYLKRDQEFLRLVTDRPHEEHHDSPLHYWPKTQYGGGGYVEIID